LSKFNPLTHVEKPGVEQQRERVLTDAEIRALWATCEALPAEMAALWKLRLITGQRVGEVNTMCWQDVDLDRGWWTMPATESKNKLAHRAPLSASARHLARPSVGFRFALQKTEGGES
jgi:integrase